MTEYISIKYNSYSVKVLKSKADAKGIKEGDIILSHSLLLELFIV